jgi:hypothetical protein
VPLASFGYDLWPMQFRPVITATASEMISRRELMAANSHNDLTIEPTDQLRLPDGTRTYFFLGIGSVTDSNSRGEGAYIHIGLSRGLFCALTMIVLSLLHLLLSFLISRYNLMSGFQELIVGTLLSQSQLLSLWLALSPWPFRKRFPTVVVLGTLACVLVDGMTSSLFFIVAILIGFPSLFLGLARVLYGWRIDFQPELEPVVPSRKGAGSIAGLFGLTICFFAMMTLIMQWTTYTVSPLTFDFVFSVSLLTLLNAFVIVGILGYRTRVVPILALILVLCTTLLGVWLQLSMPSNRVTNAVFTAVGGVPATAVTLALLCRLGWRLYQIKGPTTTCSVNLPE